MPTFGRRGGTGERAGARMKEIMTVERMERSGPSHTLAELTADVPAGPLRLEVRVYNPSVAAFGLTIGARFVVTIEATDLTSLT